MQAPSTSVGGRIASRAPAGSWVGAAAALFTVGWGANQFSSLLLAYRQHAHISATTANALFGVYAVGLIPALLIGGRLSDRHGRRIVVPVVGLSALATVTLMLGGTVGVGALYPGRFLAGVVSGLAFAPGTAWVKELSSPPWGDVGDPHVGARRAAVALSAGFGAGPLVAGVLAQWAPAPTVVPYIAHLVVVVVAAPWVWRAPETVGAGGLAAPPARLEGPGRGGLFGDRRPAPLRSRRPDPRFVRMAAPMAPWVFAAASVAFAVLPAQVTRRTGHYEVLFAAVVAGLTLLVGVAVQPYARRLDIRSEARGMQAGLGSVTAGMAMGAAAAATAQPWLVLVAAVLLGAGYGTCLVSGLLEVQRVARPDALAGLTAVFYALTYIGFAAPVVISSLAGAADTTVVLLCATGLCALTLVAVSAGRRRLGA
ncbi:MFS transporter [Acidiferrimicrobium sp. IK]|uniref:MFS transporter n=1 Tax=Acidiferrimicrobium sp. IK TaxID=2871700 RepID=UPI0021CB3C2C|nr:MFS transporter [Acidiferrimicrobium sp. IK]MCU4184472.1 MFS transporter [Acidiferrimicrobium sp. IK]